MGQLRSNRHLPYLRPHSSIETRWPVRVPPLSIYPGDSKIIILLLLFFSHSIYLLYLLSICYLTCIYDNRPTRTIGIFIAIYN